MRLSDSTWCIYEPDPLDKVIHGALCNALAFTGGDQKSAAKLLGISERVMVYQMVKHGIPTSTSHGAPLARCYKRRTEKKTLRF